MSEQAIEWAYMRCVFMGISHLFITIYVCLYTFVQNTYLVMANTHIVCDTWIDYINITHMPMETVCDIPFNIMCAEISVYEFNDTVWLNILLGTNIPHPMCKHWVCIGNVLAGVANWLNGEEKSLQIDILSLKIFGSCISLRTNSRQIKGHWYNHWTIMSSTLRVWVCS